VKITKTVKTAKISGTVKTAKTAKAVKTAKISKTVKTANKICNFIINKYNFYYIILLAAF
jgi:hypothetical protein